MVTTLLAKTANGRARHGTHLLMNPLGTAHRILFLVDAIAVSRRGVVDLLGHWDCDAAVWVIS